MDGFGPAGSRPHIPAFWGPVPARFGTDFGRTLQDWFRGSGSGSGQVLRWVPGGAYIRNAHP